MRVTALSLAFAIVLSSHGFCADLSASFPELTKLELKDEGVRVWYPKDRAEPIARAPAYLKEVVDAGVYIAEPLLLDLGHGVPKAALACDSGPSNDPSCRLLTKPDDPDAPGSVIFESPGTDFVFTASGEIYASGSTDYTYDHRRLFRFDGKRYAEVAQPFRYVGIDGTTTAPLALTAERASGKGKPDAKHTLATLPAKTPITILLNAASGDDENGQNVDYLVRTREGLVGWAHIPTKPDGTTIVDSLRYNGD
ncbi:MAG TPA: hypothetical protein VFV97_03185 [Rhodanobacteraceae bacterium]|nr:hypothetical protein [Rhodanobacteraceae bacterium]